LASLVIAAAGDGRSPRFGQHAERMGLAESLNMHESDLNDEVVARIAAFLTEIGIEVRASAISEGTVLPGIQLNRGTVVIDSTKLLHPGDVLHEAGHVAVTPADQRAELQGNVGQGPGEEMAAIAWSYAAAIHLGLEPAVVFHADGYRGGSGSLLETFAERRYIGLPMLQWLGMAFDEKTARAKGAAAYPAMAKWLID
jgi:hypothetical protein